MIKILMVGIGGAAGSMLRYFVSTIEFKHARGSFPFSTFLINIAGSLVIGALFAIFEKGDYSHESRLFLFTGVLGGFTTFSAFALENLNLLRGGEYKTALIYLAASNILGVAFAAGGYFIAKSIVR